MMWKKEEAKGMGFEMGDREEKYLHTGWGAESLSLSYMVVKVQRAWGKE